MHSEGAFGRDFIDGNIYFPAQCGTVCKAFLIELV